ncbi:alpha/beta hydrolase [Hydrocoleum sp. CS-953]|uniref:alpha/beta hydrolase n=2 Tax=Hydrocoleum sp. CS-953 TaxID=1671698 RepID=UPI000B9B2BBD|nr:alpha/beta hydrolase [Hydrocoleum sp. CS-953]
MMISYYSVPTTISPEAQEVLRQFPQNTKSLPATDDLDVWKKVWQENEESKKEDNAKVVDHYKPVVQEKKLGGVPVLDVKPKNWQDNGKVLIYLHGGAYVLFSAASTLTSSVPVADVTGLRVVSVDYTVAPFAKWDKITDQIIQVIKELIKEGYELENIAIYGDSAGGGLTAGTVLKMRDQGLSMPAAVVLWSCWSDITETGDTYETIKDRDPILVYDNFLANAANAYADPADHKNPYVSPVYGDYNKGFPPTLIQVGTTEIFFSNSVRHYQILDQAKIPVKFDPYEGMWHVFQTLNWELPESELARQKMAVFLAEHLKY